MAGKSGFRSEKDMEKSELETKVLRPWRERRPLIIGGTVFRDHDQITKIEIVHTRRPSQDYIDDAKARRDMGFPYAHFEQGEHFEAELMAPLLASNAPTSDIALLVQLCERLAVAAKPLSRPRKNKTPFEIGNEYDAQDVLHSIIRAYFKYAVSEEVIKKLGGAKSTRADFAIESLGAIVELKYVRDPEDQQRIVDELAEDLLYYEQWAPLRVFIYVVYNSADLRDPDALDLLSGTRSHGGRTYELHVVRA